MFFSGGTEIVIVEPKINRKLRAARLGKRWSIKEAAAKTGVAALTFMRWEQGQQNPSLATLDSLCQTFSMTPEGLGFGHLVSGDDILNYKPRGPKRGSSRLSKK